MRTSPSLEASVATRVAEGQIVGAAVFVLARLGFAATRVEDLLEAAGVARRTFYKYFRSKEDVLAAVYELATGELLRAIRSAGAGEPSLAALRQGLDVYLDYHVDNAPLLKVLVEQAIRSDSPIAEARRRFRHELGALLGDAAKSETGKTHDPMLYLALVSALEGLSLDLLSAGVTPRDVSRAKRVMHHLLDAALA